MNESNESPTEILTPEKLSQVEREIIRDEILPKRENFHTLLNPDLRAKVKAGDLGNVFVLSDRARQRKDLVALTFKTIERVIEEENLSDQITEENLERFVDFSLIGIDELSREQIRANFQELVGEEQVLRILNSGDRTGINGAIYRLVKTFERYRENPQAAEKFFRDFKDSRNRIYQRVKEILVGTDEKNKGGS